MENISIVQEQFMESLDNVKFLLECKDNQISELKSMYDLSLKTIVKLESKLEESGDILTKQEIADFLEIIDPIRGLLYSNNRLGYK